jgi:hypothetical protein
VVHLAYVSHDDTKICDTCGRVITWRKKWEADWANIRYCSKACRSSRPNAVDRALEDAILAALDATPAHKAAEVDPEAVVDRVEADARGDMRERARRAARRLVARGELDMFQGGRPADPSTTRGTFVVRPARR